MPLHWHVRHIKLARILDMPTAAAVEVLREGPQRWLPDFAALDGAPTTELRIEEAGIHFPLQMRLELGPMVQVDGVASLPIRWQAVDHPWLYPHLLGFIRVQEKNGHAELRFDARYIPPGGRLGWTVDRLVLGSIGRAALRDFFVRVSEQITAGPGSGPEAHAADLLAGEAPA
jgi:hypothetical protein